MKKIINGVRYDTDVAVVIGTGTITGLAPGDFSWWRATLYVTPKAGRYFLAGEGGSMTRFFKSGGADLQPMTREEALAWAEGHLSTATIERFFADSITDA